MTQTSTVPATQLYIVLELAGTELSVERLKPLFDPARVPSLLIVPDSARAPDIATLQSIVAVAQHQGVAVLIAEDCQLADKAGADGVHLSFAESLETPLQRYEKARDALGANAIIGVDAGTSRHEAMALGEAGADYVAFAPRASADSEDDFSPEENQRDLISWWAEIFEVPVVALDVQDDETASAFAEIHADFVARKVPAGLSPADLREWLQHAHAAVASEPASQN